MNRYNDLCADEIRRELLKGSEDYSSADGKHFKLCDIAMLFVASAYLSAGSIDDREKFRKDAYIAFLNEDRSAFNAAWELTDLLTGKKNSVSVSVPVRILKGGSYKIKNYYLENYNLDEIRGASNLLTFAEEKLASGIVSENFIPECIIYCGGGNVLAVVPESCDEEFAVSLEKEAKKYLVSADIAYYLSDITDLSVLFGSDYKDEMVKVENALNDRKKLIINTGEFDDGLKIISIPESSEGMNDDINAKIDRLPARAEKICTSCGRRLGRYGTENKPDDSICLSCLHKRIVGKNAKTDKYMQMYETYNGRKAERSVRTLEAIKDSDGHIAVVYGDGNNMGGIIQKFTDITQMMQFSRDVKDIAARAVFESMGENDIDRFEVVGLGGDDIFVIVPGDKAIKFSASLIRKYNEKFIDYKKTTGNVSTMSVGIAIAKYNSPVQVILEEAEKQLDDAKSEVKKYPENKGSLSFRVLDNIDMSDEKDDSEISDTMLPYLTETAETIIEFADKFKSDRKLGKTALRNLLDAYVKAESPLEADLFLEYYKAKNQKFDLPEIDNYSLEGGYYTKKQTDQTAGNKKYFIWKDLLNIIDFLE